VRTALIEGAIRIIEQEGCSAVTAGRLAREVGLGRHIIHYYFGTIEELFIAVMRHEGDKIKKRYEETFTGENPLRLIWEQARSSQPSSFEYTALALRGAGVQAEVHRYTLELRTMFTQAIERYVESKGFKPKVSPAAIGIIVLGVTRTLAASAALGISDGQAETAALVEGWIDRFEDTGDWPC
jgi:AcrR family transcriptional regulator